MGEQLKDKRGFPPGTLVYTGKYTDVDTVLSLYDYSEDHIDTFVGNLGEKQIKIETGHKQWFDVTGLSDIDKIRNVGEYFNIHPLVLEDILNIKQIPKCERFEDFLFITLKMLEPDKNGLTFKEDQYSLVLKSDVLISFQETPGDIFGPIRERMKIKGNRIGQKGVDFLMYRLIDAVVDDYYHIVDRLYEAANELETRLIKSTTGDKTAQIIKLRKLVLRLQRIVDPLKDAVGHISVSGQGIIKKDTVQYINNVSDHLNHIAQNIGQIEQLLHSCMDLQLAGISNSLNNVMKVLTIVSTIFIPLTFIAGIYGMNFDYMPELNYHWGYPLVLILMIAIAGYMLYYFRKKGWF